MKNDNYRLCLVDPYENGSGFTVNGPLSPLSYKGAVNDHVLICGSSGSGKSFFANHLFPSPDGLLLFKPDPQFSTVPLVSHYGLPDLSFFTSGDIAYAYLYSLRLDMTGIMAASLVPLLMNGLNVSHRDLKLLMQFLFNYSSNNTMSGVASLLSSHFDLLSSLFVSNPDVPYMDKLQLSFAGLGTFKSEFAADLLLRSYYSRIGNDLGSLMIDEFHHVSRPGSIVDVLLREMRLSGRLIAITQNLTDLSPAMINNFGTILIGRTINENDLRFLSLFVNRKSINSQLVSMVSSIPPHVFLNLNEYLSDRLGSYYYAWVPVDPEDDLND